MCDKKETPKIGLEEWYNMRAEGEAEAQAEASIQPETYHSQTHGQIKLSFTGRRLLANLREAIQNAIRAQDYSFNDNAVAKARGDLASYMHNLEGKQANPATKFNISDLSDASLEAELARRGYAVPPLSTDQLCAEITLRKDWEAAMKYVPASKLLNSLRNRGEYFKSLSDFTTSSLYLEFGLRLGL